MPGAIEASFDKIAEVAREVGAAALLRGYGPHRRPGRRSAFTRTLVPVADFVTSTTHKTLARPPRQGIILCTQDWAKKIDSAVFPGLQVKGPLMHVIAGKAGLPRRGSSAARLQGADAAAQVIANAKVLADELLKAGFRLISGGTDNHLVLVDMTSKGLTGKIAEVALGRAGITVNKNLIPFDKRKPLDPSGIRMGTPALTTRGLREDGMRQVAAWIVSVLATPDDGPLAARTREAIREFARDYPVPSDAKTDRVALA